MSTDGAFQLETGLMPAHSLSSMNIRAQNAFTPAFQFIVLPFVLLEG